MKRNGKIVIKAPGSSQCHTLCPFSSHKETYVQYVGFGFAIFLVLDRRILEDNHGIKQNHPMSIHIKVFHLGKYLLQGD